MIKIRLLRIGRKHQPSYKIVVVDERRGPKSGKFIEQLGFYNPITKEKNVNKERTEYWLSVGAQASDTVHNLLVREGVIKGEKKAVHSTKKKEKKEEAPKKESKPEELKKEEAPVEEPKEKKPEKEAKAPVEEKKEEPKPAEEEPKEEVGPVEKPKEEKKEEESKA